MRMRGLVLGAATLVTMVAVSACDGNVFGVRGSGNVITESRDVSGFNEIVVLGSGNVVVEVNGSESLTVEAEDNNMPQLKTHVRDGRLPFSVETSISPTVQVK
jgi:hypothetical protein